MRSPANVVFLLENLLPGDSCWQKWAELSDESGWFNKDKSVKQLKLQQDSTRCIVAKSRGKVDEIIFNDTFITDNEFREQGIGRQCWEKAMKKIDLENKVVVLKSVGYMMHFYRKCDFAGEGPKMFDDVADVADVKILPQFFEAHTKELNESIIDVHSDRVNDWIEFDQKVTGRNRKQFLEK